MTLLGQRIVADDPAARAVEVESHPLGRPERRFGIRQTGHSSGQVLAEQQLAEGMPGLLPIGWLGPLADFVVGRAVQSVLVPEVGIRTLSLQLSVGERGLRGEGRVTADAEVLDIGADTVLAAGRVLSPAGKLVTHVTGRFAVVPAVGDEVAAESVDRFMPRGKSLTTFLAVEVKDRVPGRSVLTLHPEPWMSNPFGIVHGGILVSLADLALLDAATAAAGPVRTLGLDVTFHRPASIGDVPLSAVAVVDRVGGRVAALNVHLYQSDPNRPAVTATCTMLRANDSDVVTDHNTVPSMRH
ncbi:PaaI family thioesterase [Nocardia niigatensis]